MLAGFGYALSDDEFQAFSALVHQKAGINLHGGKKELVRARLSKRIREGGFEGFRDYYDYVIQDDSGDELVYLLDAIATNLTQFFREPRHFEFMTRTILPEMTAKGLSRFRVWSAGCSTGEEPYSIAMTVLDAAPQVFAGDFKILATDLSTQALAKAIRAVYSADQAADIPLSTLRRHFLKGRGRFENWYQVKETLRRTIVFRRLNLIQPFPLRRPLDLIFCRNVMIYFDKPTQAQLVARMYEALRPGGHLFIGHSESLTGLTHHFSYVGPTIYRK